MTWTPPKPNVWGYTLAQLQAVRREAIEECARVCEQFTHYGEASGVICMKAIRELLEQK